MKKFLAVVCAFIILVLFPIVLLGTLTRYRLLTRPVIKQVIRDSQVAENLPAVIIALAEKDKPNDGSGETIDFDLAGTVNAVADQVPPEEIYTITDAVVDGVGTWWGTDKPIEGLVVSIDISKFKIKIAEAITQQLQQMNTVYPCAPDDPDCFTDPTLYTEQFMQNIPDTINLQELLQQQLFTSGNDGVEQLTVINEQIRLYRMYWQWLNWLIWIGWGTIGLFLLFIVLLRLRPGFAPFGWLGWIHVFMTLELTPVVLLVWLAPQFLLPWITGTFDAEIVTIINNAVTALLGVYLWPLIWVMVGLIGGMTVWFVLRAIVKHHNKT